MKYVQHLLVIAASLATMAAANAQFVKGNEAIRPGSTNIEVPAPRTNGVPCKVDGKCHAGAWRMVETPAGLMECTEPYARQGTCRRSSYGAEKLRRVWVVKSGGNWLQCQYPDIHSKCVPVFARPPANLPIDALQ